MADDVFISYRRSDAQHAAFALQAQLVHVFGDESVFLDRERIEAGAEWPEALSRAIEASRLVLALIGPNWLRAADEWGRRRIDDPADWVRIELARALARGIPVVPVILDGADEPPPEALNAALERLSFRQSFHLRNDSWMRDVQGLASSLASTYALPRVDRESVSDSPGKPREKVRRKAIPDELVLARLHKERLLHWRLEHHVHPWVVAGTAQEIARIYEFESFYEAVDFMAAAARRLTRLKPQHHPRWQNQWKSVTVWFSTWDVGCQVTELDLSAAAHMDECYQDFLRLRLPRPTFAPGPES